jgi:hypothetical protein
VILAEIKYSFLDALSKEKITIITYFKDIASQRSLSYLGINTVYFCQGKISDGKPFVRK